MRVPTDVRLARRRHGRRAVCLCITLAMLACWPSARTGLRASSADAYRAFALGSSVAAVQTLTRAPDRDMYVRFDRPAVLRRLEWRVDPVGTPADLADAVRDMTFDFVDDQLYRLLVAYDERRTEGLTHADMVASIEAMYGPRTTVPGPKRRLDGAGQPVVLGLWQLGDSVVSLQHVGYSGSYQLELSSTRLGARARQAEIQGRAIEAREAPARAAARLRQQADDDRAAREKSRATNRESFKP